ncbi:MAG: hypothetical protein RLZZ15_3317 [Verrucomicrobiota bacterium]|jgi:TolB protein
MQKFLRQFASWVVGLAIFATAGFAAQAATKAAAPAASAAKDPWTIIVDTDSALPVRVSGATPELNGLAQRAFATHGRYRLVARDFAYDIQFTPAGAAAVRVDITKGVGGAKVASEIVSGLTLKNALYRAADLAVEKTNGLGLRGYFTARLAFLRDFGRAKEVCNSDLFFTDVLQNTRFNVQALSPRFSPDGSRILFTSFLKTFPDIYQVEAGSASPTVFAKFQGTNTGARYSPNGQRVAMVLSCEGSPEIYVSPAGPVARPTRLTRSDLAKSSPCWSPDGGRIVFAMEPGPQLYVMSAAGGAPSRLVTGFSYAAEPDWSRTNPNKIAFTVRVGSQFRIAIYDFAKGRAEEVKMPNPPFDAVEPSWLADGRHLVYTAHSRTENRICILDTETGKSTPISPASGFGSALQANVWTP